MIKDLISEVHCTDNMEFMRAIPDKFFDLVIADPPYGIGEDGSRNSSRSKLAKSKDYKAFHGKDLSAPDKNYFDQLFRISKNQIIWGANHFISRIPYDSSCWIVWDKVNGESDFADCELAWSSFKSAVRQVKFMWHGHMQGSDYSGGMQGNKQLNEKRIHPTQKPIKIYKWLLSKYANPGDKIFDPNMGSQSSRIAAYHMGFDYWGCELDESYYNEGCKRFNQHIKQLTIF